MGHQVVLLSPAPPRPSILLSVSLEGVFCEFFFTYCLKSIRAHQEKLTEHLFKSIVNDSRSKITSLLPPSVSISHELRRQRRSDMSNTLTNSVIALYCILLYCLVLKCIVLLIYCHVDIIQYNAN